MSSETQQGAALSPSPSGTLPHKETLDAISRNIERSTNLDGLVAAIAVLEDLLAAVMPERGRLRERLDELCDEIENEQGGKDNKARPPKATVTALRQRAIALVDNARVLLSASLRVAEHQEPQPVAPPLPHDNLDRDVSAIVTTRYFQSWPFRFVVGVLLLSIGLWGVNIWNSTIDLSKATEKLREAEAKLSSAELELEKTKKDLSAASAQATRDILLIVEDTKERVGDPEKIRVSIEEEYLDTIKTAAQDKASGVLNNLPRMIEGKRDEAIITLATEWGVSPATLDGLVEHKFAALESLDDEVEQKILANLGQHHGQHYASIEDFASRHATELGLQLSNEMDEGKSTAFAEFSKEGDTEITSFADLSGRKIVALETEAENALRSMRDKRDSYLREVTYASVQIPKRIDEINTRIDGIDSRIQTLSTDTTAIGSDLGIVKDLRQPLTDIAGHLDDPFRRAQIDIATVLSNARWLVLASLLLSLTAIVLSGIAFRCWIQEIRKRPPPPAEEGPPAAVAG